MFTYLLFLSLVSAFNETTLRAPDGVAETIAFAVLISSWLFAIFLGLAILKHRDPARNRILIRIVAGAVFVDFTLGLVAGFPSYLWWNVLFLLFALMIIRPHWNRRTIVALTLGATVAAYGAAGLLFLPTYRSRVALRERFPVESLGERLAYEQPVAAPSARPGSAKRANDDAPLSQVAEVDRRLLERRLDDVLDPARCAELRSLGTSGIQGRRHALMSAHAGFVGDFITASGFGSMRLAGVRVQDAFLVLPHPETIPIPEVTPTPASAGSPGAPATRRPQNDSVLRSALQDFQINSLVDFVNQGGFGYPVRAAAPFPPRADEWVGFQSHGFRQLPEALKTSAQPGDLWRLKSLELVSLLKSETPRVYVSKNLPRMDELRKASTRDLTTFESASLQSLRKGESICFKEAGNDLRVMGALFAAEKCTQCHTVSRNDLLGAFTYHFSRVPALPEPKTPPKVY
jgi:hypothetical protein